ncbi:hypothetical protein ElyMa_001901500 [Elysia marginata]|uniref:Uncharacterized protein n=1 Tax=Elysia marginata TaxID=1093978 RepID=A0AAV4ERT3_9GAST|nr:hypothetical protein ElyMa_001901500 [Elysia marginata]
MVSTAKTLLARQASRWKSCQTKRLQDYKRCAILGYGRSLYLITKAGVLLLQAGTIAAAAATATVVVNAKVAGCNNRSREVLACWDTPDQHWIEVASWSFEGCNENLRYREA